VPWWGDALVALVILAAAVGTVVPVMPGGLLALGAIAVWAAVERDAVGWLVLAAATLIVGAGQVVKYVWPGRRLAASGVPPVSIVIGGLLGIVGFFLVPVVGLPLGFVVGVLGAELARSRALAPAWASTVEALKASGLSILVELASVLLAGSAWAAGVLALS
jgi:uncharacterized protein YqgC (DUF456 family)